MTPQEFINRWKASTLRENAGSQSHFNELCQLLGEKTPTEADPEGKWFTFQKDANKTGSGKGWADVWRKDRFAWEYKGKNKDLNAAFVQLRNYALALGNPPLLIVSDMEIIRIHTNFINTENGFTDIALNDLKNPETLLKLKAIFHDPEKFKPGVTREIITGQAAEKFSSLAQNLRDRGYDSQRVAHFMNKLIFCMFAEDIEILPKKIFSKMLGSGVERPERFEPMARNLFSAMQGGGNFGSDIIDHFNGGLFKDEDVLPLNKKELELALNASQLDWSEIEPSVFGTLFERGLDPSKRSQLGAHYTDTGSIMRIVNPVIIEPLLNEWQEVKAEIEIQINKKNEAEKQRIDPRRRKSSTPLKAVETKAYNKAIELYDKYIDKLLRIRVLDPACGSGNFLYLSLIGLKNIERRVILDAVEMGLPQKFPQIGPEAVRGIELNSYAAELARVTIWIGQIQWMLKNNFGLSKNPILKPLDQIECRDAVIKEDAESVWPDADFIVGNPPFLGDKKMIRELGEDYTEKLRKCYEGSVPGGADLVTYWFEKARRQIEKGKALRAGLVSTNSIRGGANRKVLDRIKECEDIFHAWSDEPWVVAGAAVRVSIVCFANKKEAQKLPHLLDGKTVNSINADITGTKDDSGIDLTQVKRLPENQNLAFQGTIKTGALDIPGVLAREWLKAPMNPNGRTNKDVLCPWANGMDITRRPSDTWIIDFGVDRNEAESALYELPFQYAVANIKEARGGKREVKASNKWWLMQRPRPEMRKALSPFQRYIITPRVSKYRLFTWMDAAVLPDSATVAIARDDDTTLGILHSRFHELWALRLCTWLGVGNDPRYTPSTTFETFPFPDGLTPNIPAQKYANDPRAKAIAAAARNLAELREKWLYPANLTRREPEVVAGYPDRILPINAEAETELKKRTLTNLYNQMPEWLKHAHNALDAAVAAAYGWPDDLDEDEILSHLLALNLIRRRQQGNTLL